MNYRLGVCFLAPLILVFTLIAVGIGIGPLGGKNAAQQEAKTSTSLIDSLGKNVHLAELLWVLCQQELMHANEVVEDIDFGFPEEKSGNKNYIFRRAKVDNSLLDCLRKKNLLFLLSEEEDRVPINRFTLYLDVIYARPRRDLIQSVGVSPAPSPAAISPATSRANPPSPPFFPDSSSQLTSDEESFPGVLSNKEKRTYKTVVNAVIVTAVATFIVSALLFLSYRRLCSGPGAGQGRNDVKPLLSLSTSAASSRKSFTLNSPSNRENPSNEALDTNSIDNNAKTGDFHLHSGLLGDWKISDPVGRTCSEANIRSVDNAKVAKLDTYGLLPLKPPPGRRISSIPNLGPGKTSPYSSAPPAPPPASPPPPPVPPPLKLSFGGGRPQAPAPPSIPLGSKTNPPPPPPVGVVIPPKSRPLPDFGSSNHEAEAPKAKLKPFFWDKVLTNPDHSMVWHQIKSGSFQFNEEMIETLFGYAPAGKTKSPLKESSSQDPPSTNYIQIIDRKKSQNLSILLKALNVTTEEVCDALQEGNELPSELIQSLLKMAPTTDEELKLRLYSGDLSRLGPAERFLKVIVDIPSAFMRLESLLFMCTLQEEEKVLKESFSILEAACMELRGSKLFLKLLEAVLKTGNRMNDGTYRGGAQAFKLDTLLKLSDVKGLDGKTTLLHFVVQEIVRSEGVRAAREKKPSMSSIDSDNLSEDTEDYCQSIGMQVVSGLGDELENVKRAAVLDLNTLTGTVSKLAEALVKARDILNSEMKNADEENGFYQTLRSFVQNAEVDIRWLLEEEKRIMALVKSTGDYFHGSSAKDEGLRIFIIVRDFLVILERVCRELENSPKKLTRYPIKHDTKAVHPEAHQSVSPDTRERICTLIKNRRIDDSSSDDDNL